MNNGEYYLGCRLRALSNRAFICACVVAGLIAGGCRSSRNVVQESETIEHNEFNTSEKNESVHSEANDSICQRDTIKGGAGECGRIDIERDTAGRPVVILWEINSNFSAEVSTETLKKSIFDLRGSSDNAETSGSVDSVTQKKEEAKTDVKIGIPLGSIIGWGLVAMVVIYLMYGFITEIMLPWINRLKK
ncbi:MAG: hypothetical protein BHV69_09470 [Bacteroidales bacterium 52_46]|nr:MAG: hypothetical protein BHV69_09470 [Bacteroidales bacterium 52_46]